MYSIHTKEMTTYIYVVVLFSFKIHVTFETPHTLALVSAHAFSTLFFLLLLLHIHTYSKLSIKRPVLINDLV